MITKKEKLKRHKLTKTYQKKQKKRELNKKDKEWRENVLKNYDNCCCVCGRQDLIHCHHFIPRENKQFRHNPKNGCCLCPNHHKFSLQISAHKSSFVFLTFFEKNYPWEYMNLLELLKNSKIGEYS